MHPEAADFARPLLAERSGLVLEVGARDVNGSARRLAPPGLEWVGVDLRPGPGVDLVVNACAPGFPALYRRRWEFAGTLVCMETLEHVARPDALLRNLWQCGAPGGLLILTTAGPGRAPHSGVDGGLLRRFEAYQNFSRDALEDLLERANFAEYRVLEGRGGLDVYAWAVV